MWDLTNLTPYRAFAVVIRDRDGREVVAFVVKGTFDILLDGSTTVAQTQVSPVLMPKFAGDPSTSSLLHEIDFVPTKLRTDVIVHGSAYAPEGERSTQVDVQLQVAGIDKTLRVRGDRFVEGFSTAPKISPSHAFSHLPVVYERALGGMATAFNQGDQRLDGDMRNPAGTGYGPLRAGMKLPNIEYPSEDGVALYPAGFGPIARHWSSRARFAGTYDDDWRRNRMPLVPVDFDDAFYQCAPVDQQAKGFLKGGEEVRVWNMHPRGALTFELPRVRLDVGASFASHTLDGWPQLHTVELYPDFPSVVMTWHCVLPCHNAVHRLRDLAVRQVPA